MTWVFTSQSSRADLPGAVAALACEVVPVSQQTGGPCALEGKPGVNESGGPAVMIHKERLASVVLLHLPASGQLQLFVGKHVEECHQVPVVLVALEVVRVSPNFTDHMLQTRVGAEHTVGTKVGMQHSEEVGAGEELGAGRLEQEVETGTGAGLGQAVVPPQISCWGHVRLIW